MKKTNETIKRKAKAVEYFLTFISEVREVEDDFTVESLPS